MDGKIIPSFDDLTGGTPTGMECLTNGRIFRVSMHRMQEREMLIPMVMVEQISRATSICWLHAQSLQGEVDGKFEDLISPVRLPDCLNRACGIDYL